MSRTDRPCWMDGWMGGWVGGRESRVKDRLQQSTIQLQLAYSNMHLTIWMATSDVSPPMLEDC
jgi:hypothetical protein